MISKRVCSVYLLVAVMVPTAAWAKTSSAPRPLSAQVQLVPPLRLADVVVNTPPAAAPAPAPAAVPVAPVAAPVAPVETTHHNTTLVDSNNHRSYMGTIAVSALMGAVAGALVGGSLYFLADDQTHARRIGYWAAGGVLVGTTVGVIQVATEESRADRMVSSHLPTDPVPTFRLALLTQSF